MFRTGRCLLAPAGGVPMRHPSALPRHWQAAPVAGIACVWALQPVPAAGVVTTRRTQ